jgi:3-oxoacyl-(acyl-carrier-protein) synthase
MKVDLAVIGQGAVTPAGLGVEALRQGLPKAQPIAGLRRPEETWPVLRVEVKALQHWQSEPRLRRASPLTLFLIETAEQALASVSPADRAQTGLIVAYSAGCLAYSARFFSSIVKEGQKRASPALFPETVFNSPGSHVAAALNLNSAAYALVGDETAWIAALKTASIWLRRKRVQQVLVLGAEEFDPLVIDAYRSARWLRPSSPFLPSEGAAGLLVRLAEPGDSSVIATARNGFIYRRPTEAAIAAEKLLRECDPKMPCYPTARRNWLGPLEMKMTAEYPTPDGGEMPYLGEAFTASAAWNTIRALCCLSAESPALLLPIWGLNNQLGALDLKARH